MGWMPGVDTSLKAVDGNSRYDLIRCDGIVIHTIGGGPGPALAAHWSVRRDGYIWQHRDSEKQSAANLYGNPYLLSIENGDRGPGWPEWDPFGPNINWTLPPLTLEQIRANARIISWAAEEHGFPIQLMPNSLLGQKGVAPHRWGIDGNWIGYRYPGRVTGGLRWSSVYGKVCPSDKRIDQIIGFIIPIARQIGAPKTILRSSKMFIVTEIETPGGRVAIFDGGSHYDVTEAMGTRNQIQAQISSGQLLEHRVNAIEWDVMMGLPRS